LDLVEAVGGLLDPCEGEGLAEAFELGTEVGVAEKLGGAGLEEEKVFEEEREGAEEGGGLLLAFGSGAVGLGHLEESGVVWFSRGVVEEEEGVGAGGGVGFEIEAEGFACGSLGETGDEGALFGRDFGAAVGEEHLDFFYGQCPETDVGAAGANGGEKLAGVLREKDEVDGGGRLFENFEEGVGGFLHEAGCGEDEDFFGGLTG